MPGERPRFRVLQDVFRRGRQWSVMQGRHEVAARMSERTARLVCRLLNEHAAGLSGEGTRQ